VSQSGTVFCGYARGVVWVALLALAGGFTPLPAQEVYKSVDADGHVIYSERGATKNAPTTTVHVTEPDPAEAGRLAKQQQLLTAAEKQRQKEEAAADKSQALAQHDRQQKCERARAQFYRLHDARRIYAQRDADNNPIVLSDEDADAAREKARRAMVDACGS
jgi:hypothetical protein